MDASGWGLVGAIVGALASIITTWIVSYNAHRLQSSINSQERLERARAFQRDTLIAVQDTLHDAMRLMIRANREDQEAFQKSGRWRRGIFSDETKESTLNTNRKLTILTQRIADDDLRAELKKLRMIMANVSVSTSENDADENVDNAMKSNSIFMDNLGHVLRGQY